MASALLLLLAVLPFAAAKDCRSNPNGVYNLNCFTYVHCINGVEHWFNCLSGQVYDDIRQNCTDRSIAHGICGIIKDCTTKADGSYADNESSQHCTSYYICRGGTFFGHIFCPGGTVFSEELQTCVWPDTLPPPCGTKTS